MRNWAKWHWGYTRKKYMEKAGWRMAQMLPKRVRYYAFMLELGRRTMGPGVPVPEKTVDEILRAG